ncbi:hypothetical protein DAI22_09g135600 [Oryza sativa Japonica Group]|nr:hypothetical protein DAI22_09g135600 [Oryza sativa Japonica Group]
MNVMFTCTILPILAVCIVNFPFSQPWQLLGFYISYTLCTLFYSYMEVWKVQLLEAIDFI